MKQSKMLFLDQVSRAVLLRIAEQFSPTYVGFAGFVIFSQDTVSGKRTVA